MAPGEEGSDEGEGEEEEDDDSDSSGEDGGNNPLRAAHMCFSALYRPSPAASVVCSRIDLQYTGPAQPVHHCGGAAAAVVGGMGGASRLMYPERAGNHLT